MRNDPVDWLSGRRRGVAALLVRSGLWCAQWPYRAAIALRNRRFDAGRGVERVEVPVIALGNLTTGGTGKTPAVIWVCRRLREQGVRVATISRGYGADRATGQNDEALELERSLPDVPHLQNPDRVEAARLAIDELASRCLVLDDAFQHRRIARDLDWVLIDARNPFGFGYLLPRGLLREPRSSLRRADAVLLTRADQVSAAERERLRAEVARHVRPGVPIVATTHRPLAWVSALGASLPIERSFSAGEPGIPSRVAAFCGIGNPEAFRGTLESIGIRPCAWRTYPDHHRFTREDLAELAEWVAASGAEGAVCTIKDLVKLSTPRIGRVPLWGLEIGLAPIDDPQPLDEQLARIAERALAEEELSGEFADAGWAIERSDETPQEPNEQGGATTRS
ncbi:MAG TPA: tetraacyldisaccharide 4'-kinase [Pirellulaceae bacterium]|nr:tetraacyldisaccharide 4'-kinase [Pirellulaceae bacterium]